MSRLLTKRWCHHDPSYRKAAKLFFIPNWQQQQQHYPYHFQTNNNDSILNHFQRRCFHYRTRVLFQKDQPSSLNYSEMNNHCNNLNENNQNLPNHEKPVTLQNSNDSNVKFETKDYVKLFLVSILGGCFGGMVGLGGNIILIPLLTQIFSHRLSAKQIVATCLITVVTAGLVGSSTLYFKGDEYVDIGSAIFIAGFASLTARFGVKLSSSIQDRTLKLILAFFMLFVAPLVVFTGKNKQSEIQQASSVGGDDKQRLENSQSDTTKSTPTLNVSHDHSKSISKDDYKVDTIHNYGAISSSSFMKRHLLKSPQEIGSLFVLGSTIGIMSGLLGVGGGVLAVPMLSFLWLSEFSPLLDEKKKKSSQHAVTQQLVMGTSLAAMTLPSSVALYSHWRVGNVLLKLSPFLLVGSAMGAYLGSSMASEMDEEILKRIFAVTMIALGGRQFWKAYWKK
ncbi:hypothetical protein C9374_011719 [Naegleria lovaniensis]|uniref:Membrane transporter protein n=1 Tax=Naegleria lovaniensis TaxID=51637 RepID=A0AA88KEN2_NAELO|nr:uncharacterized protein C9374_011719 [Naegleria lovaniensis]KAG2373834.1 hypothetical protein C9374_011719 [Naegleria lovaniensis]